MMQGDEDKKPAAKPPDHEEAFETESRPAQTKESKEVGQLEGAAEAADPGLLSPSPPRVPSSPSAAARPRQVKRKPKDMPRRPLSAYNFFFKEERERLMAERSAGVGSLAEAEHASYAEGKDKNTRKKELFASVGKLIAERWKTVAPSAMGRYKLMAEEDMGRYNREMSQYQIMMARKKRTRDEQHVMMEEAKVPGGTTRLRLDPAVAHLERIDAGHSFQFPLSLRSATSAAVRAGIVPLHSPRATSSSTPMDPALRLPAPIEELLQARRHTILTGGAHGPPPRPSGTVSMGSFQEDESILLQAALIRRTCAARTAAAAVAVAEPQPTDLRGNADLDVWLNSSQDSHSRFGHPQASAPGSGVASLDQLQQHQLQLLLLLQEDRQIRSSHALGMTAASQLPLPSPTLSSFAGRSLLSPLDSFSAALAQPSSLAPESSQFGGWSRGWAAEGLGSNSPTVSPALTTPDVSASHHRGSLAQQAQQRQRQSETLSLLLQYQQHQQLTTAAATTTATTATTATSVPAVAATERGVVVGFELSGGGGSSSGVGRSSAADALQQYQQFLDWERLRQSQQQQRGATRHRASEEDESSA